jgi:hypothetical protein
MIVFSESDKETALSKSAQDIVQLTKIAEVMGCRVYFIPKDFSVCENAENALWHIAEQSQTTKCFWVGFIPSLERYEAIYKEALKKNILLLNSPLEHQKAQEFDLSYPLLEDLTPESYIVKKLSECSQAIDKLGFPLFVRGSAKSKKSLGWKSCVANTKAELEEIVTNYFSTEYFTRDRVILRKFVSLRYHRTSEKGFPLGREFRVFIYHEKILGYGYYWDGEDPLMALTSEEEKNILLLAKEAAKRLKIPFIAVDVGQLIDGIWTIIEVNDGQFAGTGQMDLLPFWDKLIKVAK